VPDFHADFLSHYERELGYLRQRGADFAARYPKVAGRLEMGSDISPDPHVERLLESFAFLTGRIQQRLDSEFPLVAASMLGVLYPQFLNPVPSVSIARIEVDPDQGKLTTGYTIDRHTQMSAETPQGLTCRFRTTYPVTLWPIDVCEAKFEPPERYDFLGQNADVVRVLRLRLESTADSFEELEVERLRFYLGAPPLTANGIYELLFANVQGIVLLPEGESCPIHLPSDAIEPVGFGPDEGVLPFPPNSHPGYRLLQEYFTFPSKFQFFDLTGLEALKAGRSVDVLILLDQMPSDQIDVDENTFLLGCTPIVNLFKQTSEPIRLDQQEAEYRLVPDARRERTTEIHSILSVSATADSSAPTEDYAPYFSYNHRMQVSGQKAFWVMRREATTRSDLPGTQSYLSLVDLEFNPSEPPVKTIYAHTLCTNRVLASQIPARATLQMEQAAPIARITCLDKPTPQLEPPLEGDTLWRLISHLSLNHLSLTGGGQESLRALQEILRLYSFSERPSTEQEIQGIRDMRSRPVVRRIGSEGWRGFCRGTEVRMTLDEDAYVGGSTFLFASVLNRFLALYASVNSFTQLSLTSTKREGLWHQWPPMAGDQPLL
jgi:type VI secretion system protein ImpG